MTLQEFESMTGMFPSAEMYSVIEDIYCENGDVTKEKFCEVYRENRKGFAKYVQQRCDMRRDENVKATGLVVGELKKRLKDLEAQNASLREKLEAEQEWKPWINKDAVPQDKCDKLAKSGRLMSDDEALEWVASELGFAPSRVRILHELPEYEVNHHGALRPTGTAIDRRPRYDATDWHYVLFEVHANTTATYELYNGEMTLI